MEHRLAEQMVVAAAKSGLIPKDDIAIYQYGFELFISSLISVILVFILAGILGNVLLALIYLLGFIPIRVCAGGYHGRTHAECYLVFCLFFFACCLIALHVRFDRMFPMASGAILLVTMIIFAPVEAKNKPLTEVRKKRNRKCAVILSGLDLAIAIVIFLLNIEINSLIAVYFTSKWTVIIFTIWPVAYEAIRKLVCVKQ